MKYCVSVVLVEEEGCVGFYCNLLGEDTEGNEEDGNGDGEFGND
jgi:hypothetical protein